MEKRRLLIVDSSDDFQMALQNELQHDYLVKTCFDGKEALSLVDRFYPDILVLDLMIPLLDGISLLEALRAAGRLPTVMVITTLSTNYTMQSLSRLNIGYIMVKPIEIHAAVERIRDLDQQMRDSTVAVPDYRFQAGELLISLGFLSKHRGYHYVLDAIVSMAEKPGQSITKELYPAIAAKHNCEQANVERSIRTAIEFAWKQGDRALWLQYFPQKPGSTSSRPTNSHFISRMASVLLMKK